MLKATFGGSWMRVPRSSQCSRSVSWRPAQDVLWSKHEYSTVLLSLRTGRYFTLDRAALPVNEALEEARHHPEWLREVINNRGSWVANTPW